MAAFSAVQSGCGSSPPLEAIVMKVSPVEAEFHRMISEDFRGQFSDLQVELCRKLSEPERGRRKRGQTQVPKVGAWAS